MTTTPTHEVDEVDEGVGGAVGDPSAPGAAWRKPWWKTWRILLAVLVIVPTFIGQIVGTDDAWPFAPFRMFASPTRRTTSIVHPEFRGVFVDGTQVALYSTDFRIRPAEVESELDRQHRLPPGLLANLGETYNRRHPDRPLRELDLRMVGQALVDGRPGQKVDHVVQRWVAS